MSKVAFSLVFALILVFHFSSTVAQNKNPCDELMELTSLSKHQLTLENAFSLLRKLIRPDVSDSQTDDKIVFTQNSGFALLPTCNAAVRFERSLYYPIGLTGIKLGERSITTDGKPKKYSYILTNYGLRVYIPSSSVREMDKKKAYIFANSKYPTVYCAGHPSCNNRNGREIHAKFRYAVVDIKDEISRLIADSTEGHCGTYRISPFNQAHVPTKENDAVLSTCIDTGQGIKELSGNVEITWKDKVLKESREGVDGSFARLSPKMASEVLSLLALSNTKECSTERTEEEVATIGLAAKTPEFFVGASADMQKTVTYKRKVPGEYYFRFAAYSWNIENNKEYDIEDIAYVSKCKDLKPHNPLYISLYSEMFPEESVTIDVGGLSQSYIRFLGKAGLSETREIDDLRQGRFWYIVGSDQYFQWRGVVMWKLNNSQQVRDLLLPFSDEKKYRVLNFLTHVVLASSFRHDVEKAPRI